MSDKYFKFKDPVYDSTIHCFFGRREKAIEKLSRLLKTKLGPDYITEGDQGCAVYLGKAALIYLPKKPKTAKEYGTLAHEIWHCTSFVFNHIGADYNHETGAGNEHFAYYIGYVTEQIYKRL